MLKYLIIDTETTGLNIIMDKPFLIQYGLVDEKLNCYDKKYYEPTDAVSHCVLLSYLQQVDTIVGANIKFDIHMLLNIGVPAEYFIDKNYIDIAVLARLVINHDTQADGSFTTALKRLGVRYLGVNTADEERKLKLELSQLQAAHRKSMRQYFIDNNLWPMNLKTTEDTKMINDIYSNWNKIYHNYPHLLQARRTFLTQNPAPTYKDVSNIKTYGLTDITITGGLFALWYKKIVSLKQIDALKRSSAATFPLVIMERTGMTVNLPQILKDRNAILAELKLTKIIDPRTAQEISIGQHAKLKELYEYESGELLLSADKETRTLIESKSPAAQTANYLAKMDKYLNTYITGILNKLVAIDSNYYKVFTQYNMAGTITGRLSSDFQQFPRDPLVLKNGYEVNIRSWFVVPREAKYMFYFDYAQMELRLQCEWTNIVCGAPDINLARAFNPYKCIEKDGKYYLEEDLTIEWSPVDLHGMTAKHAFPGIDEHDLDWKHYRGLGKRANFACNYGASAAKIQQALHVDMATAKALVAGFKTTFKGVVEFGKWISRRVYTSDSIPNLLLRRYYSRNKHQLQNWLVQGSGADILLLKLAELAAYIKNKPHWNLMISVHDEVGLTCMDIDNAQLVKEVKEIQDLMCHKLSAVDITCDVEYTTTTWADKDDWKGEN